ncbi:transient receptor potential cation channel subfamily M member-like 2 isoform X2 [Crassostrea virginica]
MDIYSIPQVETFLREHYKPGDETWERPNMIFSVIGDSNNLVPKVWPKSHFQLCLTYAAKAAGECWILSKGEPTKISKIVREMVEQYIYLQSEQTPSIRLISIPTKPVDDETLYFDLPEKYEDDKNQDKFFWTLDGAPKSELKGTPEFELAYIGFRFNFEMSLQKPSQNDKNALVIVLVEGDLSAIEHVKLAVENNIPVVIIEGTGGAADLLAEFITAVKEDRNVDWKVLLPTQFRVNLGNTDIELLKGSLQYIKDKTYLVDVFDIQHKDEEQFAAGIGELLHRAWSLEGQIKENNTQKDAQERKTQMDANSRCISVIWNRGQFEWYNAKKSQANWFSPFTSPFSLPLDFFYEFSKTLQSCQFSKGSPIEKEQDLLLKAILSNRTDYIETLLDMNVSLSNEYIDKLYKMQIQIIDEEETKDSVDALHWVIKDIGGKPAKHLFEWQATGKTDYNANEHAQKIIKDLLNYNETEDPRLEAACYSKRRQAYVKRQRSLQAILLWSLLFNKGNITTMIWRRVANQLYTGLVCSVVLGMMAKVARLKDRLLADELDDHSTVFKKRVTNMMDTLYQQNKEETFKILESMETVWKIQAKPIFFAYEFDMYDVIAHPCSVALMDNMWYNGLIPDFKRFMKNIKAKPRIALKAVGLHFFVHYLLFFGVLVLYSLFLLTPVKTMKDSTWTKYYFEITLYIWTGLDFAYDLRNIASAFCTCNADEDTQRKKLKKSTSQLKDMWKVLGLFCILLVIAAFLSRTKQTNTFILTKRFSGLLLVFSYLRCSRLFFIHRFLGISFMFIKHMLVHLLQFLSTTIFMVIGVGIFYQSLLYDNESMNMFDGKWYKWKVWYIIYYPYYQMYGEIFEDKLGFNHEDEHETDWAVTAVAAIYMLVANLLVICLITAMFTTKYEAVREKSEKMWQYERFHIISDFQNRMCAHLDIFAFPFILCRRTQNRKKELSESENIFRNYRHLQILQYIMAGRSLEKSAGTL